jgi:NAD(P)-dependent dehydrogenase (short-subunit alcohol dehydrogenase family)
MSRRSVVVTGASSGIGLATVEVLSRHGFHVFGTVRRQEDFHRLPSECTPLLMDVTDEASIQRAFQEVSSALGTETLLGLVNNAGIAVHGPLAYLPIDDFRRQLEVNLVAPVRLSQVFAPLLGADRSRTGPPGRIVNISSVSGKIASPFLGAYAASKFGLEAVSESMRRELLPHGIDVIVVAPGAVVTPIWDKAEATGIEQFRQTEYATALDRFAQIFLTQGRQGFPPERVGEVIYTALATPKPKTRYAVVPHKFRGWVLPRITPPRLTDRYIGKLLGLTRIPGKDR